MPRSIASTFRSVLAAVGLLGCGGDGGRAATAPELPVPLFDAACAEIDDGSDGSVDSVRRYTYDSAGFVTAETGASTTGTYGAAYTYGPEHFLLRFTSDDAAAPGIEVEQTLTRDGDGRILTIVDRRGTTSQNTAYTYDDLGRLTRAVSTGESESTLEYAYDGDSLLPRSARFTYATGQTTTVFTWSADGRRVHSDIDEGDDGSIERTGEYTYDEDLRLLSALSRTGTVVTARETFTYNSAGHTTSQRKAFQEGGLDALVYQASFDENLMLTLEDITSPDGSVPIYRITYKPTCATPRTTTMARAPRPTDLGAPLADGPLGDLRPPR